MRIHKGHLPFGSFTGAKSGRDVIEAAQESDIWETRYTLIFSKFKATVTRDISEGISSG